MPLSLYMRVSLQESFGQVERGTTPCAVPACRDMPPLFQEAKQGPTNCPTHCWQTTLTSVCCHHYGCSCCCRLCSCWCWCCYDYSLTSLLLLASQARNTAMFTAPNFPTAPCLHKRHHRTFRLIHFYCPAVSPIWQAAGEQIGRGSLKRIAGLPLLH